MKKLLLFFALWIGAKQYAQDLPNVVPPSPEAQAFQKYGDMPVSTYTGVPNISIPLYTATEGDISASVSLSYHASGIKVAEEASRVGLGWSIIAGGMISRTVVGRDDFGAINSYHNGGIPELNMASHHTFPLLPVQNGNEIDIPENSPLNLNTNFINVSTELYDFEPDQYSYNFMGYSGKFILTPSREVILEKREKIKIQCMDANANTWEVWTPDGMHYFFEIFDTYREETLLIKSTWFLNKVISPNGYEINFQYDLLDNQYIRPLGSYQEIDNSQRALGGDCTGSGKPSIDQAVPGKEYVRKRLQAIDFDLGVVEFNYGLREDLEGDSKLESVTIFQKTNGLKEAFPFKEFHFNYDYFVTTTNGNFNNSVYSKKRLRLLSLNEVGNDNGVTSTKPPYEFKYEQGVNLPAKTSFSRDHWGYYNGKGNTSLIPTFTSVPSEFTGEGLIGVMGTERDANPNYMVAGSLNEIIYPTGGSTQFYYEAHDYDADNSAIDTQFYTQPYTEKNIAITYNSKGTVDEGLIDLTDMYVNPDTGLVSPTTFTVKFRASNLCGSEGAQFGNDASYYSLYRQQQNGSFVLVHTISIGSGNVSCDGTIFYTYFDAASQNTVQLNPGIYKWIAYIPNDASGGTGLTDIPVTYRYNAIQIPEFNGIKYYNAGGLRIKKIVDKDNIDPNNDQTKTFHYNYKEDRNADGILEDYSHGILRAYPRYSYFEPTYSACVEVYLVRTSNSTIPLFGNLYGNAVGYSEVTVLQEGNGKSVYTYRNQPSRQLYYVFSSLAHNLIAVPSKPPFKPVVEDAFSGLLEKRTDFKEENGVFYKTKEVENLYDVDGGHNFYDLYYGIELRRHNSGNVWNTYYDVAYIYPAIRSNFINLTSTTERYFDENDESKKVPTNTTFTYDYDTHLQLKTKTFKNSKEEVITTGYKYALDFPQSNSIYNKMVEYHIMNQPIDQVSTLAGTTLSTQFTKYSNFGANAHPDVNYRQDLILPENIQTVKGEITATNLLEPRITFEEYDSYGSPLEVSKADGPSISYIWGYNGQYPVAKIEHATYSQIASVLGISEEDLKAYDQTDLSAINGLRSSMPGAMVSTYTYDPLIGVTSMTGPRGYTINYQYDDFNRLKEVKDAAGNLVTDYQYHFKNQ